MREADVRSSTIEGFVKQMRRTPSSPTLGGAFTLLAGKTFDEAAGASRSWDCSAHLLHVADHCTK